MGRLAAILLAAGLTAGTSLAIYRVFLAPTQAVEIELDAGVEAQVVAQQIAEVVFGGSQGGNVRAIAAGHPASNQPEPLPAA